VAADEIRLLPTGSYPLKVYLPCSDVDVVIVRKATEGKKADIAVDNQILLRVNKELCDVAFSESNHTSNCAVRSVTLIAAKVPLVQCVINNISVDISINQVIPVSR
jgi:DNA polymerase sigma